MKGFLLAVGALLAVSAVVLLLAAWRDGPGLPKSVREVDIRTLVTPANRYRPRVFSRRITDPAQVNSIVGWVNSLQPAGDNVACGSGGGGDITLTFRSLDGSTLATADAPAARADSCSPVNLTINLSIGTQSWPRVDTAKGMSLIDHLERLLGPRFRPIRVING